MEEIHDHYLTRKLEADKEKVASIKICAIEKKQANRQAPSEPCKLFLSNHCREATFAFSAPLAHKMAISQVDN